MEKGSPWKKIAGLTLVAMGAVAASSVYYERSLAACSPYAHLFEQCDAAGISHDIYMKDNPTGGQTGLWVLNGSAQRNEAATLGSNLAYNSTTKVIDAVVPAASPIAPTVSIVTRPINSTAFQPSATKFVTACYSVTISVTSVLLAGQDGTLVLETNPVSSGGTWTEQARVRNGTSGVLGLTNPGTYNLCGAFAAGLYARIRQINNTGTPTYSYDKGWEASW